MFLSGKYRRDLPEGYFGTGWLIIEDRGIAA